MTSRELPPEADRLVAAIANTIPCPTKTVVVGGIGTGKTATLSAVRATLRAGGVDVFTHPTAAKPSAGAALVVDDAHLLSDRELDALADWVDDPEATVVVAAQPYHSALRELMVTIERENPPIVLGPVPTHELHRITTAALGGPPPA
ncbi:MAG: hypothetical protein QOH57_1334, partial [Mycobacterium sp.]|nr:hypothetical protein [Mycobacterium sp.]